MRTATWLLGVASLHLSAWAQEPSVAKQAASPLEISGFIDVGYSGDLKARTGTGNYSEIELDFKKTYAGIASFRVDLNVRLADLSGPNGALVAPGMDTLFEQAFVTIDMLKAKTGLTFTFGKFNAPYGWELLDPVERYQLSLSNVFSYLEPFNLLGAMATWEKGPFTVAAYAFDGWDRFADNNSSMSFGGRFGVSLAEGKAVLGLSAIWGPEGPRDGDARTSVDLDFTFKPNDKFLWGLDVNFGMQPLSATQRATWYGVLSTFHYRWTPWLGTTLRYDFVNDPDGAMIADPDALANGIGQQRHSVTAALLFFLNKGSGPFGVVNGAFAGLEYRADISDKDVFRDNSAGGTSSRHRVTAKVIVAF